MGDQKDILLAWVINSTLLRSVLPILIQSKPKINGYIR